MRFSTGISIFYINASEQAIRQRIKIRAEQTGRDVPEHLIVASLQAETGDVLAGSSHIMATKCDERLFKRIIMA